MIARLSTPLGLTETGRGAFAQDTTAGLALYLSSADWSPLPIGTEVQVSGRMESRYGLTTLRNRHVEVNGSALKFDFKGKSGKT